MAAGADRTAGAAPRAAAEGFPPHHRRPRREQRHTASPHGARHARRRASVGPRGERQRPGRLGGLRTRRHPDARGRRFRAQVRRRGQRPDPRDDAEGRVPVRRQARARACGRGRPARCARRDAARPAVPEADALGRLDRRWQGRVHVRPAHSLDAVPVRREGRAVRHPPQPRRRNRTWCRTCAPAPSRTDIASWP